ncbi:hypothetical protein D3C87_1423200 [compost metagenome]
MRMLFSTADGMAINHGHELFQILVVADHNPFFVVRTTGLRSPVGLFFLVLFDHRLLPNPLHGVLRTDDQNQIGIDTFSDIQRRHGLTGTSGTRQQVTIQAELVNPQVVVL